MNIFHRCYNVHGLQLQASASSESTLDLLNETLRRYQVDTAVGFRISLESSALLAETPVPSGLHLIYDGPLPDGTRVICRANEKERSIVQPGRLNMRIDLIRQEVHVRLTTEAEPSFRYGGAFLMLCELLRTIGHHHMHAAALVRANGRALILTGPSGAGKTTTALALAHAGLSLLADDACFICQPECGQPAVWGMALPCKVHRRTEEMIPWLTTFPHRPARDPAEAQVDMGHATQTDPDAVFLVDHLIFLSPRNPDGHTLQDIPVLEAIARLSKENILALDRRGAGAAGEAFRMAVRLAEHCRCRRLSAGPTIDGLAQTLLDSIEADTCD